MIGPSSRAPSSGRLARFATAALSSATSVSASPSVIGRSLTGIGCGQPPSVFEASAFQAGRGEANSSPAGQGCEWDACVRRSASPQASLAASICAMPFASGADGAGSRPASDNIGDVTTTGSCSPRRVPAATRRPRRTCAPRQPPRRPRVPRRRRRTTSLPAAALRDVERIRCSSVTTCARLQPRYQLEALIPM